MPKGSLLGVSCEVVVLGMVDPPELEPVVDGVGAEPKG